MPPPGGGAAMPRAPRLSTRQRIGHGADLSLAPGELLAASAGRCARATSLLALGVIGILVVLILPLPRLLLDLLLALSITLLGADPADRAVHREAARVQRLSRPCC